MSILKKIIHHTFFLICCAAITPTISAQSLWMGHAKENVVSYVQVISGETAGSALFYPQEIIQAYEGCQINAIKVSLDGETPENGARVFISRKIDETPLYEKTFTASKGGWQTITLDTPLTITGEALYIGYEAQGQQYLPYTEPFVGGEEWVKRDGEGWRLYNGRYSAAILFNISCEGRNLYDVQLTGTDIPEYILTHHKTPVSGSFKNLSGEDVNALTFTYQIEGTTIGEETLTGLSVKPRTAGSFTLKGITLDKEGEYLVNVRVKAVNGEQDILPEDNQSEDRSVVCRDEFLRRNTLLEIFSTEKCSGCPAAHQGIADKIGDRTDLIEIGHHAGFYTDDFTLQESLDYEWFYPTGRLYAPAMMFDRTNFNKEMPTIYKDGVPVTQAGGITAETVYNKAVTIPAVVALSLKPQLDSEGRMLSLHISGERLLPINENSDVRLFVYLTEDSIFSDKQAGAAKGFWQRHVARKSVTPTWGKSIDLTRPFTEELTDIALSTEWRLDKMEAIAFIATYNPEDKNDCRVLNAAAAPLTEEKTDAIPTLTTDNNGDGLITVYTLSGRCVLRKASPDALNRLSRGVYIVNGKKVVI